MKEDKSSISQSFDRDEAGGFALSAAVHPDLRAELKSFFIFLVKLSWLTEKWWQFNFWWVRKRQEGRHRTERKEHLKGDAFLSLMLSNLLLLRSFRNTFFCRVLCYNACVFWCFLFIRSSNIWHKLLLDSQRIYRSVCCWKHDMVTRFKPTQPVSFKFIHFNLFFSQSMWQNVSLFISWHQIYWEIVLFTHVSLSKGIVTILINLFLSILCTINPHFCMI